MYKMASTLNSVNQTEEFDYDYLEEYGYVYNYYESGYMFEEYDLFVYKGFHFEKVVYLVVWELLVILTALANVVVIVVFLRRSMRNSTNMILISVAVTDSMTGLVTLPVYSYIYSRQDTPLKLTEIWCKIFMIVKFFASKSFHTMSIWLTVCLGFQRLVSVCFPFRAHALFTVPRTIIMIVSVITLSPCLHIYHLLHTKAIPGDEEFENACTWKLEEPCVEGCIHLWLQFYFMHFIPSMLLVMFTGAMVFVLCKSFKKMRTSQLITNKDNLNRRTTESRRISLIVLVIVIVFLIPEIPYGIFVLLTVSFHLGRMGLMELRTNRVFLCVYEVSLVLSFHANFWIYFIMNRRFRRGLKKLFQPCTALFWKTLANIGRRRRIRRRSESSSFTTHPNTRNTSGDLEMNTRQLRQEHRLE